MRIAVPFMMLAATLCPGAGYAAAADFHAEGETLFVERGCVRCHTVGRGRFVGPDLRGVFRRYSREKVVLWITDPSAVYEASGKAPINEGYPPMPRTRVGSDEAGKIADYLSSLQGDPPEPSGGGTVGGNVVNETAGDAAEGVEVTLRSFVGDRPLSSRSKRTGEGGKFSFEGLEWTASHQISIESGGVLYETGKMVFKPRQRKIEVSLPVYETSVGGDMIDVELNHIIVEPSHGGVNVAEFAEFMNRGKTVVVSGGENGSSATLRFGIPRGAVNLNFIHGADSGGTSGREGAFGKRPVLPGMKRTVFSYRVPFENGITGRPRAVFTKTLEYATSFFVVVAPASANVTVEGLGGKRRVAAGDGEAFSRWDGTDLKKGHKVRITVVSVGKERPAWILPALIFMSVFLIAGLYSLLGLARREG